MKKKIKDICYLQPGIHMKVDEEVEKKNKGLLVNLRDFDENNHYLNTAIKVDTSKAKEKYFVGQNDILFSTRMRFNAYQLPKSRTQYIASNSFVIIRTNRDEILPEFLMWSLNSPKVQNKLEHLVGTRSRVPFLSVSVLEELKIDVPSLEIQQKIIELDQLKNKERELIERIISLKEQYIQTILLKTAKL